MNLRSLIRPLRLTAAAAMVGALSVSAPAAVASAQPSQPGSLKIYSSVTQKPIPDDSHYCDGCTPPLVYQGGPVADTSGDGLTITPIYWLPSSTTAYPAGYENLINRYISDVAADSGGDNNVYSVDTQYYSEDSSGTKTNLVYKLQAGTPIIDTQDFPTNGCTPDTGFTTCLTDAQLQQELIRLQSADNLPIGLANFYPVFTAPTVETFDSPTSSSLSSFCGYHAHIGTGSDDTQKMFYGDEVFEAQGCGEGSWPNGNEPADSSISTLSHEISEFMTDPDSDNYAWGTKDGSEIGDVCGNDYGTPLGSTDPNNPQGTEYNQVINGDKYYTQTEFSNSAYATLGAGFGCQQSTVASTKPSSATPTPTEQLFIDATPNAIDADGSTTSQVEFYVTDQDGNVIPKDKVQFSEYVVSGTGSCGSLKQNTATTDDNGYISDNYTASTSDVVCAIVGKDALGGKAATVDVYQGKTQSAAPTADATYPQSMTSGQQVTFTNVFKNNGTVPIADPTFDITIYSGDKTKTNVDSSQVTLSYSLTGTSGKFASVPLTGSTINDGGISTNWTPPVQPPLAAGATMTVTYELTLAPKSAAGIANNDLISLEGVLEQENLAAGTTTTIADTYASDVNVSDSGSSGGNNNQASSSSGSSSSGSGSAVVGAIILVVILALIALGVILIVRRRRGRPAA